MAGKDLLLTGNKSSVMYAMDPATGKTVWQTRLGRGGASGGIMWGPATDGKVVYTPVADPGPAAGARPGVVALQAATGKEIWRYDAPKDLPCSVALRQMYALAASPRPPPLVPGPLFAGADDESASGRSRPPAQRQGALEYDTTTPVDTVNGVKAAPGGSLAMGGPTIAGGMMFMHSGYSGSAGPNNLLLAISGGRPIARLASLDLRLDRDSLAHGR